MTATKIATKIATRTDKWTPSDRIGHAIAVWFGCGHVPIAPGTAGTIGAIPLYLLLRPFGPFAVVAVAIVLLFIGVWAAGTVVRRRGSHDPQIVVVDEVVGLLLTAAALPPVGPSLGSGWRGIAAAFVLFRRHLGRRRDPTAARLRPGRSLRLRFSSANEGRVFFGQNRPYRRYDPSLEIRTSTFPRVSRRPLAVLDRGARPQDPASLRTPSNRRGTFCTKLRPSNGCRG